MKNRRSAGERHEKTDHEIKGMVGREDTEVAHAWPEWIKRCERDALLQIIFVRHHAAFRAAARSDEPVFITHNRRDPACIVYSSGTGGRPKGCMIPQENYLTQYVVLTARYP